MGSRTGSLRSVSVWIVDRVRHALSRVVGMRRPEPDGVVGMRRADSVGVDRDSRFGALAGIVAGGWWLAFPTPHAILYLLAD